MKMGMGLRLVLLFHLYTVLGRVLAASIAKAAESDSNTLNLRAYWNINITDITGNDLSNDVTVLHPSPSAHRRRQLSYSSSEQPTQDCQDPSYFFTESACDYEPESSQFAYNTISYTVKCKNSAGEEKIVKGECTDYRMCVQGYGVNTDNSALSDFPAAICSDEVLYYTNFSQPYYGDADFDDDEGNSIKSFHYPTRWRPSSSLSAVATGPNDNDVTLMYAQHLEISADSVKELFGAKSYNTLGLKGCNSCAATGIHPVPAKTMIFGLQAVFAPGARGKIFLPFTN